MMIGNGIKMKDIDKVHGAIDRPTKLDKELSEFYGMEDFDFLNLSEKATHRKVNHDPLGMMKAMMINPEHGAEIYLSHIMLDKMSNIIRDSWGTDNRDIAEVFFNRALKSINNSHKYYRPNPFLKKRVPVFEKKMRKNRFARMDRRNLF